MGTGGVSRLTRRRLKAREGDENDSLNSLMVTKLTNGHVVADRNTNLSEEVIRSRELITQRTLHSVLGVRVTLLRCCVTSKRVTKVTCHQLSCGVSRELYTFGFEFLQLAIVDWFSNKMYEELYPLIIEISGDCSSRVADLCVTNLQQNHLRRPLSWQPQGLHLLKEEKIIDYIMNHLYFAFETLYL